MSRRPHMLASVIREVIAPVLRECPRECGVVSISEVEVSQDFSYATAYITALKEPERALDFLEKRRSKLQHQLGSLHRAKIPALRFRLDKRMEHSNRIDKILGSLEEE